MSRAIKAFASSSTPVVIAVSNKQKNVEIASFVDEKSNVTVITNAKAKNFIPFSPLSGTLLNPLTDVTSSFDKNDIKAMSEVAVCKSCGSHLLSTAELASDLKGTRLHCVVCGEEVDVDEEDEIEDEEATDENDVDEIEEEIKSESDADESETPEEDEESEEETVEESSDDEEPEEEIEDDEVEIEESDLESEEEVDEVKDDEVEESSDDDDESIELKDDVEDKVEESSDDEEPEEEVKEKEETDEAEEAETTNVDQEKIDEENGVETSSDESDEPEQLADETNAEADDEESEDVEETEDDEELPDEEISASVKKRINLNMFNGVDVKSSAVDLIKVRNEGKYYIMCNSKPVATLNKELASEEVQSFFDNESNMRAALNASLDDGFTKEVCANFGLKPIKVSFRASKAVRQEIAKLKSKLANEALASVEDYKTRYAQALSIASVGVNKSIYGSNILRDALAKQGVLAGMVDAEDVVNEMFAKYGEDYIKEIISKANELVEKSDEARNAEASVVANASFNCTVSKSVAKRLGSHIPVESKVIEVEASAKTNGYSKLF